MFEDFETVMDGLEVLQTDETVFDVLNTVSATTLALSETPSKSRSKYVAIGIFNDLAAKRIEEIHQNKQ